MYTITIKPFQPPLLSVQVLIDGKPFEILVDPTMPVPRLRNGVVTFLVCPCGTPYISSQRQTAPLRSCYHLHCPNCGRALSMEGALWQQLSRIGRLPETSAPSAPPQPAHS